MALDALAALPLSIASAAFSPDSRTASAWLWSVSAWVSVAAWSAAKSQSSTFPCWLDWLMKVRLPETCSWRGTSKTGRVAADRLRRHCCRSRPRTCLSKVVVHSAPHRRIEI